VSIDERSKEADHLIAVPIRRSDEPSEFAPVGTDEQSRRQAEDSQFALSTGRRIDIDGEMAKTEVPVEALDILNTALIQ